MQIKTFILSLLTVSVMAEKSASVDLESKSKALKSQVSLESSKDSKKNTPGADGQILLVDHKGKRNKGKNPLTADFKKSSIVSPGADGQILLVDHKGKRNKGKNPLTADFKKSSIVSPGADGNVMLVHPNISSNAGNASLFTNDAADVLKSLDSAISYAKVIKKMTHAEKKKIRKTIKKFNGVMQGITVEKKH